jgi:hypothetical protein
LAMLLGNLISDFAYVVVDPRIDFDWFRLVSKNLNIQSTQLLLLVDPNARNQSQAV